MNERLCSENIKRRAIELGASLCGIADEERFEHAPEGFRPTDIMPECKSVVVLALRFPRSAILTPSPSVYTFVRNRLVQTMDMITMTLAGEWDLIGRNAVPIPSDEPYEYWDSTKSHGQGILSLKHAAVLAGLGEIGKNTLLINDTFGNMLWLGAILLDQELEADPIASYEACLSGCSRCLDACPAGALNGISIEQRKCRAIAGKSSEGGGYILICNQCRKLCPRRDGI